MISATDEEWETVGAHADHRGLPRAAYLTALAVRDVAGGQAGPPLVMTRDEQRMIVEALRELRRGLAGDGDTPALIADIQVRIATMFDVWARDLVAEGEQDALLRALSSTIGEDQARTLCCLADCLTTDFSDYLARLGPGFPGLSGHRV